ncbi:MAG TPA: hypothetical protein VIV40_25790 [Kofleriaceae bacterium]
MSEDLALDTCGCCARQPCACATTTNRAGLPAIRYRLGTHATFLCSLIDRLPSFTVEDEDGTEFRPLAKLTTRVESDPTIALLDAFAVVCDVLTFYQERIANEGYLRTATERRSVLELAREVGYELNPGVAAATYLAFVVEDAPSAPKRATVAVGTKVQSVPGPDERPQVFETLDETVVRAEWNALVPRQTHVQRLVIKSDKLYVDSAEVRELYLDGTGLNLKPGDALLVVQGGHALPLAITSITEDGANARTRVDLGARLALPIEIEPVLPAAVVEQTPIAQTLANVKQYILGQQWEEEDLQAFIAVQKWDATTMLTQVQTLLAADVADAKVYTFKQRVGFFGASAPLYDSLPIPTYASRPKGYPKDWDDPPISIWRDGTTDTNPNSDLILMAAAPAVIG